MRVSLNRMSLLYLFLKIGKEKNVRKSCFSCILVDQSLPIFLH